VTTLAEHPAGLSGNGPPSRIPGTPLQSQSSRDSRITRWGQRHKRTLVWLTPILVVAGLVQAINLGGSPARIDDEGTYTAQAWSVLNLGQLTHYTYWYDHPPLGWLQIAAWEGLTGGFQRYAIAVVAAREAMVVATLISVALLWFLARRIGIGRPAAAVATVIFAVSPLAVQFHRTVYLDNVATPWLLASLLLASTRKHQLIGFAGAAAALGIAVLSKETYLLALPLVAWLMWKNARPETRRYTVSVAGSILVLIGGSYLLLALVKGELFPGPNHTSLIGGIQFQLGARSTSGAIFTPDSLSRKTIDEWFQLDPVLLVVAPVAAAAGVFVRRTRPFAVALLVLIAIMFRPGGYLPVPYVIMLLPLAALVIAGVTEVAIRRLRGRNGIQKAPNLLWIGAMATAVVITVPLWGAQLRGFWLADLDSASRQAESWVETNIPKDSRLIVDDSMWVDLVTSGFARDNVIWFYKLDSDTAIEKQNPNSWRDSDYVITTKSMTSSPNAASADRAIQSSTIVASFGTGDQRVQVRQIEPNGAAAANRAEAAAQAARADAGNQLTRNSRLTISAANYKRFDAGQVDQRITISLGELASNGVVSVVGLPIVPGEEGLSFRQVVIGSINGQPTVSNGTLTPSARILIDSLDGRLAPERVTPTPDGITLTFSVAAPDAVVQ
jgi:4-amino-4-deoxy-L-arabinose transferase-like glycosyltransferase